jgi:anaerobic ribonucleoside-triphosphate reductase activating protein
VTELTWILDPATGDLTVEGLDRKKAMALAGDLLPPPRELNCARPLVSVPLPPATSSLQPSAVTLRVARVYHGSVVEGPGRRSVVQTVGCPIRCKHCHSAETHDPTGGVVLEVAQVVATLLDPTGKPRDGVSVLGGEPVRRVIGQ